MSNIDVDTLFQTRTIVEVREVQAQTKDAIEQKKKQLRQEVGNSYRDLISSADTIVEISDQSQRVVQLVDGIGSRLQGLATEVQDRRRSNQGATATSSLDRLFALGSRIKYLIDTPETIWGSLDAQDYLTAAQRSVYAGQVHRAFASRSKQISQHFPLLHHQWPLVKKLSGTVWERACEWLGSQGGASASQAASTLAALALLRPIDGAEVLKMYLTARQRYVLGCLAAAATGPEGQPDPESLTIVLADVACMICSTVAQCGELFMQFPGVVTRPLLLRITEDMTASELLFDAGTDATEAAAVAAHCETVCTRLASLSAAGVSMECSRWLEVVSQQAAPLVTQLLGACATARDLSALEGGVKAALDEWAHGITPEGSGEGVNLIWNDACQWVLGQPCALWPLLFEQPLVERARELVALKFRQVEEQAQELVNRAISDLQALPPASPGTLHATSCALMMELQPTTPTPQQAAHGGAGKRRRTWSRSGAGGVGDGGQGGSKAWLSRAEHAILQIDARLYDALEAAVNMCQSKRHAVQQQQVESMRRPAGASSIDPAAALDPALAARAASLEPFVQDKCVQAIESISKMLATSLPRLDSESVPGSEVFHGAAHAALVVGRVAIALEGSAPMRVLLGSPSQWSTGIKSLSAASTTPGLARTASLATAASGSSPRLDDVHRHLRQVGNEAYEVWATWAAAGLARRLVSDLALDTTFRSDTAQRGWEEVVVSPGGGEDEMRFPLPAAPSPAAMALALGACAEIDRSGGHVVHEDALSLLRWKLGMEIASTLQSALGVDGPLAAPSERGSLQLMFDARFMLGSLLAGAAPPPQTGGTRDATSLAAAVSALRRGTSQVESEIASHLDPIDWATYDSHVQSNVARFTARSKILLGMMRRGAPQDPGTTGTPATGGQPAESNVLCMAPAGARFAYLPVNTPSLFKGGIKGKRALVGAQTSALSSPDPASHYSFAALAGEPNKARRAAAGGGTPGGVGGPGAAGGSSAFEALRQSRFGSLLGDKAAEAAASVQEFSLGGLSGGNLFSSLNLSSFKK